MKHFVLRLFLVGILLLAMTLPSYAIKIEYTLSHISGDTYQYNYTVTNDGSLGPDTYLQLFDIEFDPALYLESSLLITSAASLSNDWWQSTLASAPGIPALFDVATFGPGIAVDESLDGFSVQFRLLDPATIPSSQEFIIWDINTFLPTESGTTYIAGNNTIPEPCSILLLGIGFFYIFIYNNRKRDIR